MAEGGEDFIAEENREEDDLSEEQHDKLVQYQEVTGTDDLNIAKERLARHNWNLESAVQDAFNESEGFPPVFNQQPTEIEDHTPSISSPLSSPQDRNQPLIASAVNSLATQRQMSWMDWLIGWALVPYRFTFHVIKDFFNYVVQLIWPSFQGVLGRQNPIEDVMNFKRNFDQHYGVVHPTFYQGTYSQVLSDAKKELRFLLVYLHSDSHQDTPKFCTEVLCNPGFTEYVNGNMLFWACSVNSYEGYRVSRAIRETTYPSMAVVCLRENKMTIVWKLQGYLPVDRLIALLSTVINENEASLIAARAEREELSASQAIRNAQDREFEISQELDREKARKRKALEDAKKEEEDRKRAKELEKERKLMDIVQRKKDCRQRLADVEEPTSNEPGTIQIKLKLPDGSVFSRAFCKTDQYQLLIDFVFGQENTPNDFLLNSNFPRKAYPVQSEANMTIEEAGISSSTILFVQNLTEESSDEED